VAPELPVEPVAEAPEEAPRASFEGTEVLARPEVEALAQSDVEESEAMAQLDAEASPEVEASDVMAQLDQMDRTDLDAPWTMGLPGAAVEDAIFSSALKEPAMEAPVDSALPLGLEQAAADALGAFDPMAFDEGADSFVVESLEPEPISLAPSDIARMEVDAAFDPSVHSAVDAALGTSVDVSLEAAVDSAGAAESTGVASASDRQIFRPR
jgi:hypothetical protein